MNVSRSRDHHRRARQTVRRRLPGADDSPWSGVVRLKCSADLPTEEATALADITARLLPSLASTPHKDPAHPRT